MAAKNAFQSQFCYSHEPVSSATISKLHLVVVYAAATTTVIIVMCRLHVQVIAVAIYGCGMVIVVTASAIGADAVRPIPVSGIAAVSDGKRASGRIAAVADAKPRTTVTETASTSVPTLR